MSASPTGNALAASEEDAVKRKLVKSAAAKLIEQGKHTLDTILALLRMEGLALRGSTISAEAYGQIVELKSRVIMHRGTLAMRLSLAVGIPEGDSALLGLVGIIIAHSEELVALNAPAERLTAVKRLFGVKLASPAKVRAIANSDMVWQTLGRFVSDLNDLYAAISDPTYVASLHPIKNHL